jgi:hypothetical protein
MESYLLIVFCLVLNTTEGFENCNFLNNSIIVSYGSDSLTFGCDKSPNFTLCELFKEVRVWDQRCYYIRSHSYFQGKCHRVQYVGSETRCEYLLEDIRQNGNDFILKSLHLLFKNHSFT